MRPDPAPTAPETRRHPVRRAIWLGVSALVLIAAFGLEARSIAVFHTAVPWSSPERIHFCGRDYLRGAVLSAAPAHDGSGASSWQRLTRGPLLQPVYGHPASAEQRATLGVPCTMVLYLRDGDGYRAYGLSGGP